MPLRCRTTTARWSNDRRRKPALELVAIGDRVDAVSLDPVIDRQDMEVWRPAARPAGLRVASPEEQPVRPGIEAGRVAELRQVTPDAEERLLAGVLGEVRVAQDPVGDRVQSITHVDREARKCPAIEALRPDHEVDVHVPPTSRRRSRAAPSPVWVAPMMRRLELRDICVARVAAVHVMFTPQGRSNRRLKSRLRHPGCRLRPGVDWTHN
jgi:hypothetical protein